MNMHIYDALLRGFLASQHTKTNTHAKEYPYTLSSWLFHLT